MEWLDSEIGSLTLREVSISGIRVRSSEKWRVSLGFYRIERSVESERGEEQRDVSAFWSAKPKEAVR